MEMTDEAKKLWLKISPEHRAMILANVWCSGCREIRGIRGDKMTVEQGNIVIRGVCLVCNGPVARVVETS